MCCRPNSMHRTRSCPSNGYNYPLPAHFANGASPHEAQSYRPPSFHPGRAHEPEYRHRGQSLPRCRMRALLGQEVATV